MQFRRHCRRTRCVLAHFLELQRFLVLQGFLVQLLLELLCLCL
jgi:hypothetical protein